ncbi:MAG: shikimate dehydrogenase [Alphaproteobacteria bacterium]|nr:shikimate dehydrogenase [Alphaproteobacteria bacterium]
MMLTGAAKKAGVMGWPISHSRSPLLHNFWLGQHSIDGVYVPMAVQPGELATALRALRVLGFAGCNLTIPHKEAALAAVETLDPDARRIGAVNTIIVTADGALEGRNTDAFGFIENLRASVRGWTARRGPAVVIGAGGAARAILVALLDDGASEIRLINRTPSRASALAEAFGPRIRPVSWARRAAALSDAALLVNATNQGMAGEAALDLPLDRLPPEAVVNDIVYAPLETPLLAAARRRGNPIVDGLGMLLHQARPGFAAWFGVEPEVTPALRRAVLPEPGSR